MIPLIICYIHLRGPKNILKKARGVIFIGVATVGSQKEASLAFLKAYNLTYPNVQDTAKGATGIDYGITGSPETFFINKKGVIVSLHRGALNDTILQERLKKIEV